jgi:hypothetical protein
MSLQKRFLGLAPIAAGVAAGILVLAPVAQAAKLSDEARRCGAEGNSVEADVVLPAARDIWKVLPALGITPELESDDQPARLIVFKDPYDPSGIQFVGDGAPKQLSQVICVIQDDGTLNLYLNVSRDGSSYGS